MSKNFVEKNIRLSLEFDKYLSKHPKTLEKIPDGACIVITVKGDVSFSRNSMELAEKIKDRKEKCIEAKKEGMRWTLQPLAV